LPSSFHQEHSDGGTRLIPGGINLPNPGVTK
ncbi:MAG: hypothetical protein RLZZ426_518, partial [Actinomycetota bacterium]